MKTGNIVSHPRPDAGDFALVAGLRLGSSQALEELIFAYRPRVYAVAFRFTRNHHDAEDIVQEVFLRAFRTAPRFRGDCALGTWLYAIALNAARNRYRYWRRRQRDTTISLDTPLHPETQAVLQQAAVEGTSGAAQTERNDFIEQIQKGMARLSARDRQILHLRNVEYAGYSEIAGILGVTLGTVKSRIARARARLHAFVYARIETDAALLRCAC